MLKMLMIANDTDGGDDDLDDDYDDGNGGAVVGRMISTNIKLNC